MTQATRVERIGLLGGSFDPVHVGHLALARAACAALQLTAVRFIPTSRSWQKENRQTDAVHRIAMLDLALAQEPHWTVDTCEVDRGGATYTVETLETLRQALPAATSLVLILGSDQMRNLATWHRWRELLTHCHIAATQRETVPLADFPPDVETLLEAHGRDALSNAPSGDIVFFRMPAVPVSSTRLRAAIAHQEPIAELLPANVAQYIERHQLYRQDN